MEVYAREIEHIRCQAKKLKDRSKKARALINVGVAYYAINDMDGAKQLFEEAIFFLTPEDEIGLHVDANVFMSITLIEMGILEGAYFHAKVFKDFADESESLRWKGDAHQTMARIMKMREEWDGALQNYETALKYLKAAELENLPISEGYIHRDMGFIHLEKRNFAQAEKYLSLAHEFWEKTSHNKELAELQMYIARLHFQQGDLEKTKAFLEQSFANYTPNNFPRLHVYNLVLSALVAEQEQNKNSAQRLLEEAYTIAKRSKDLTVMEYASTSLQNFYTKNGSVAENSKVLQEYNSIILPVKDSVAYSNMRWLEKAHYDLKLKDYRDYKASIEAKDRVISYQYTMLGSVVFFLIVSTLYWVSYRRLFKNGNKLNKQLKKLNAENQSQLIELEQKQEELNQANAQILKNNGYLKKELSYKALELTHKQEMAKQLSEIMSTKAYSESDKQHQIENLVLRDVNSPIWEEFENHFKEANDDFYQVLTEYHPNLSPAEMRLCSFLKMNLTTKEIANLTFKSPDGIKVARSRLRKKLNLAGKQSLSAYLNALN